MPLLSKRISITDEWAWLALPEAHAAGSVVASIHTWLGDTILWLAGVHAAAALFHHFVLRDRVLRSMLPG